jgi:hypothetical protein
VKEAHITARALEQDKRSPSCDLLRISSQSSSGFLGLRFSVSVEISREKEKKKKRRLVGSILHEQQIVPLATALTVKVWIPTSSQTEIFGLLHRQESH